MDTRRTLLVTLNGRDRPGVTAKLTQELAGYDVEVLDIEQIVVRGVLILGLLLGGRADVLGEVGAVARRIGAELGLNVEVVEGALEDDPRRRGRLAVTVLGSPLRPGALSTLAQRIASEGANIDRITRVASYPVTAVELEVSGVDRDGLRRALADQAITSHVDVAVQYAGLHRRGKHLVVMDVDSTLIQNEVIEVIARHAGCEAQVAAATAAAMNGEIEFADSLRARVALLAGVDAAVLDQVRREITITPGARTLCRTLKRLGYSLAVVSGGFSQVVDPLADELGIDHSRANMLEIVDGRLTGKLIGDIVDRDGKARALRDFAELDGIPLSRTIAIGDGANDLDMLAAAGLGVAFNAKQVVREAAHTSVNVPFLDAVLYLLGITREQVEEADAAAGVTTPAPLLR
jgi:phosphoserine phosphatase